VEPVFEQFFDNWVMLFDDVDEDFLRTDGSICLFAEGVVVLECSLDLLL
jgi:hypothetical protein